MDSVAHARGHFIDHGQPEASPATGRKVFGQFPVKRARTLILDFEGARLTARRIRSHCRGLGVDAAAELPGWLMLKPCTPAEMHSVLQ